jgi:4-hydroxybenzoate polyprenyltransferase
MREKLFSRLKNYFNLLRIGSWPKNFFVLVAAVFSKHIFEGEYSLLLLSGFVAFSIASSIVYIFNDIADAPKDAIHPLKKNRPLASGVISKTNAAIIAAVLVILLTVLSFQMSWTFIRIIWIYIAINVLYSTVLKEIVIVDLFCIASGFMLRVIAGAYLIGVFVSNWLVLTTIFLSLFLAVMKRRVELARSPSALEQRTVLKDYSISFTDQIGAMTGSGVAISYALYTVAERTVKFFGTEDLVYTTIFVIFGIFRYMYIVYKKDKGENVIEVLYTDLPMMINLFLYGVTVISIIYFKKIF